MNPCPVCGFDPCVCYSFEVYDVAAAFPKAVTPEVVAEPKCVEITSKGKPCKNKPKEGFTRCGPHQDKWEKENSQQMELSEAINEEEEYDLPDPVDSDNKTSVAPPVVDPNLFIVAGTGSRSLQNASREGKAELMNWLRARLTRLSERYGDQLVIMSGMAEGFDKALAMMALQLDIKLWCAIPSANYGAYYWGPPVLRADGSVKSGSITGMDQTTVFNSIVERAWKVTYVRPTPMGTNGRFGGANFDRNDFMVAQANAFLVYDPSSSGTAQCYASIQRSGKPSELVPVVR